MNKENTCQHVCTWKLESGFTCQHIYKYVWKSLMKGFTFSMHVLYIKRKSSFIFFGDHVNVHILNLHPYTIIYVYICQNDAPRQPLSWLTTPPTLWLHPTKLQNIYIYILKRNTCKFEEVKISSGKFNLD